MLKVELTIFIFNVIVEGEKCSIVSEDFHNPALSIAALVIKTVNIILSFLVIQSIVTHMPILNDVQCNCTMQVET